MLLVCFLTLTNQKQQCKPYTVLIDDQEQAVGQSRLVVPALANRYLFSHLF